MHQVTYSLFSLVGLQNSFKAFGPMKIEWPGKEGKHPRCPTKGLYHFAIVNRIYRPYVSLFIRKSLYLCGVTVRKLVRQSEICLNGGGGGVSVINKKTWLMLIKLVAETIFCISHWKMLISAGYVYILFDSEKSVKALLQACTYDFRNGGEYFFKLSSRRVRSKEVKYPHKHDIISFA